MRHLAAEEDQVAHVHLPTVEAVALADLARLAAAAAAAEEDLCHQEAVAAVAVEAAARREDLCCREVEEVAGGLYLFQQPVVTQAPEAPAQQRDQ
eukprot:COSAG01_NODE_43250_length_431_cov_5.542169_1_plen_95_part_00